MQISIGNTVNADGTQIPLYATPGAITASVGASIVGSIAGATLTVTSVSAGILSPGDAISGTDSAGNVIVAGTAIQGQISGPTGGTGTYALNGTGTFNGTLDSTTITVASTVLNVTAVGAQGVLQVGQTLSDQGLLAPGTMITGLLTGAGAQGTYLLNQQQIIAPETMSTSMVLLAQIQAQSSGDLRHTDMLNLTGSHRVAYLSTMLRGTVRVAIKGGDLLTTPNGSVYLVQQTLEPWYEEDGWVKVLLVLQTDGAQSDNQPSGVP